jgi:release factor glutamine methyltransferase
MSPHTTLSTLRAAAKQRLIAGEFDPHSARLDADTLIMSVLQLERTDLFVRGTDPVSSCDQQKIYNAIERRLKREPVAYITGQKEFWSLPFRVTPSVLIPRPETEWLVQRALELIGGETQTQIYDIGTGSGAIAVSLAHELREKPVNYQITASDICPGALTIARKNAIIHGTEDKIDFRKSSLLEHVPAQIPDKNTAPLEIVLANLPYVPQASALMDDVVNYEPHPALFSGPDGTDCIELFLKQYRLLERSRSVALLEFDPGQVDQIRRLVKDTGLTNFRVVEDLSKRPRFVEVWLRSS